MLERCRICGAPLDGGTVCTYCGAKYPENRKAAQSGSAYRADSTAQQTARRANRQAEPMDAEYSSFSRRSKWIAFLLCLFLGWLGVHRMYCGKWGSGILYAATRGLYGVGIVVDLILILCDQFTDDKGMPLNPKWEERNGGSENEE